MQTNLFYSIDIAIIVHIFKNQVANHIDAKLLIIICYLSSSVSEYPSDLAWINAAYIILSIQFSLHLESFISCLSDMTLFIFLVLDIN